MKQHKHIGVYALIIKDDNILLIKKARGPYTGKWDLPGGSLEFGENLLDGLVREVMEETGLLFKESSLLNVLTHTVIYNLANNEKEEMYHIGIIFKVSLKPNQQKLKTNSDGKDSAGASWVKMSDINEPDLSPFANQSIKMYLN
ncbi:MAG: NUDIX domain-containing protein [Candidatus Magasanikiibacteriota bacterium]